MKKPSVPVTVSQAADIRGQLPAPKKPLAPQHEAARIRGELRNKPRLMGHSRGGKDGC